LIEEEKISQDMIKLVQELFLQMQEDMVNLVNMENLDNMENHNMDNNMDNMENHNMDNNMVNLDNMINLVKL
jgi:hypothetical protein